MVIAISAEAPDKHLLLRPEVKYIGNMHGNEVRGISAKQFEVLRKWFSLGELKTDGMN